MPVTTPQSRIPSPMITPPDTPTSPGAASAMRPQTEDRLPPGRAAQDWRPFLRALGAELDAVAGIAGRDSLLHGVGRQLARQHPLSPRVSTEGLALDMNEVLDALGWGRVRISFSAQEGCLYLTHEGMPRVGGQGDPPGTWLAATLAGLYEGWMAQQPGANASLVARCVTSSRGEDIVIRYGRE